MYIVIFMTDEILVVGNGVSYRDSKVDEIDYTFIVRMNDFKFIKSNKIDYWVVNSNNRLNKVRASRKDISKNVRVLIKGENIKKIKRAFGIFNEAGFQNVESLFESSCKLFEIIDSKPSTGLVALYYFKETFSQLNITGFDLIENEHAKCFHYWGGKLEGKRYGQWYPHNAKKEIKYLHQLLQEKKINVI